MNISPITDYDIQALIDHELSYEDEKEIRGHIESNREAQKRYEGLLQQKRLLQNWWKQRQMMTEDSLLAPCCEQNGAAYTGVIH